MDTADMAADTADTADADDAALPYWQVNVPPAAREAVCPPFLRDLSDKDRRIVGMPQAAYAPLDWPAVRALVAENRLGDFQRDPLALRRYLAWSWGLRARYGSAVQYVLQERLGWDGGSVVAAAAAAATVSQEEGGGLPPLAEWVPPRVRILCNDWPYGLDPRIVHLVVWTQFVFAEHPVTGDLTPDGRAAIQAYVAATFAALPAENVVWFKNWRSLKSVRAVEHFHVMLFDPPPGFVAHITGGDVPLSERLADQ